MQFKMDRSEVVSGKSTANGLHRQPDQRPYLQLDINYFSRQEDFVFTFVVLIAAG